VLTPSASSNSIRPPSLSPFPSRYRPFPYVSIDASVFLRTSLFCLIDFRPVESPSPLFAAFYGVSPILEFPPPFFFFFFESAEAWSPGSFFSATQLVPFFSFFIPGIASDLEDEQILDAFFVLLLCWVISRSSVAWCPLLSPRPPEKYPSSSLYFNFESFVPFSNCVSSLRCLSSLT